MRSIAKIDQRHFVLNGYDCGEVKVAPDGASLVQATLLSGYGLVNAVTHFSQEVDDYDRATEFEHLAGKLIELPPPQWKVLAEAV